MSSGVYMHKLLKFRHSISVKFAATTQIAGVLLMTMAI